MAIVALYEGDLLGTAKLVAASGDPDLARTVAELLAEAVRDGYEQDIIGRARLATLHAISGGGSDDG